MCSTAGGLASIGLIFLILGCVATATLLVGGIIRIRIHTFTFLQTLFRELPIHV